MFGNKRDFKIVKYLSWVVLILSMLRTRICLFALQNYRVFWIFGQYLEKYAAIKMYETELTIVNMVLQIISISNNAFTNKFIMNTFDIGQSLYRILWIDSITIILSIFCGILVNISNLVPSIHYGRVGCFILGYLSHTGFYITPFLTFLISFIR